MTVAIIFTLIRSTTGNISTQNVLQFGATQHMAPDLWGVHVKNSDFFKLFYFFF